MSNDYTPIDCHYFDVLEAHATNRVVLKLEIVVNGKSQFIESRLLDFRTKDKEEFVLLENGMEVRLDRMTIINSEP